MIVFWITKIEKESRENRGAFVWIGYGKTGGQILQQNAPAKIGIDCDDMEV